MSPPATEPTTLNPAAYTVAIVPPGNDEGRLTKADAVGVKSVPVLVIEGQPYCINSSADISALKESIARTIGRGRKSASPQLPRSTNR